MSKSSNEIDQMIEDNQKLVYFILNRHFPTFFGDEDLIQAGMIGLWKACKMYDPDLGKFSTLASKCIKNEMLMELRDRFRDINQDILSIDYLVDPDESMTLKDIIADPRDEIGIVEFKASLDKIKAKLSERDSLILDMYVDGFRQQDIAEILNLTRANVSRIMVDKIKPMLRKLFS